MKLVVATPVRCSEPEAAQVSYGYHRFIRGLWELYGVREVSEVGFASDVVRARNRVSAHFLRESPYAECEWVLWLDDDQWADDPKIVGEMMALGVDVVGAPYTTKRQPLRWTHQLWPDRREEDDRGLLDVRGLGFGFTLTSRRALFRLSELSHDGPGNGSAPSYIDLPNVHRVANIFGQLYDDPMANGDYGLASEDLSFCKRWRDQGGKVYLYTKAGLVRHAGAHVWDASQMPGGVIQS